MTDPQLQPCGTNAAFARHVRHDEEPCEACRIARNEAQARRRKQRLRLADPDPADTEGWDDSLFEQAACHPWTGSHDSRNPHETDREFNARLDAARRICRDCPAATACLRRARHMQANDLRLDGIFAGRHYRYGGAA